MKMKESKPVDVFQTSNARGLYPSVLYNLMMLIDCRIGVIKYPQCTNQQDNSSFILTSSSSVLLWPLPSLHSCSWLAAVQRQNGTTADCFKQLHNCYSKYVVNNWQLVFALKALHIYYQCLPQLPSKYQLCLLPNQQIELTNPYDVWQIVLRIYKEHMPAVLERCSH